jgi:hypothetical protein
VRGSNNVGHNVTEWLMRFVGPLYNSRVKEALKLTSIEWVEHGVLHRSVFLAGGR